MGGADRLDEHALVELIHRTVVDITRQIAKIDLRLCSQDPDPANELCTLHTTIDGDYHTELVLHADRALLHRLTENMMEAKTTDPEDMEEYSKEFFNVLCGHIVSEIFRRTKLPARFDTVFTTCIRNWGRLDGRGFFPTDKKIFRSHTDDV